MQGPLLSPCGHSFWLLRPAAASPEPDAQELLYRLTSLILRENTARFSVRLAFQPRSSQRLPAAADPSPSCAPWPCSSDSPCVLKPGCVGCRRGDLPQDLPTAPPASQAVLRGTLITVGPHTGGAVNETVARQ